MTLRRIALLAVIAASGLHIAWAGEVLKITIPKRSELTPVQRLNRQGVEAVERNNYEKAAELFYKAYLYDPTDPFTLNNMGYMSELHGQLDLAEKFYTLASEQESTANIDQSSSKQMEGKPMTYAFSGLDNGPMQINRMNVRAMYLLSENRVFEAIALLEEALPLDSRNPFTLNNLGVANEAVGDFDNALKYYREAAESQSAEPAVVTLDRASRGRPVTSMAMDSARRLQDRIRKMGSTETQVIMLSVRGVSAINKNDWPAAKRDFLNAYRLDPSSAFSLNNRGYVAERDGDLETAQFFYGKARQATDSSARIGLATNRGVEGKSLAIVAADSHQQVDSELAKYSVERHHQTGPIELTPRDNTPSKESDEGNSSSDLAPISQSHSPQKPQ
ncbi:MAG: tetratricopeptide repeat protein [Terracidiphilus sp.]|jgi:Flp pilus assembly protein TadD